MTRKNRKRVLCWRVALAHAYPRRPPVPPCSCQHGPIVAAQEQEDDVVITEKSGGVTPRLFGEFDLKRVAISGLAIGMAGSTSDRTRRFVRDTKGVRSFGRVPTVRSEGSPIVIARRLFRRPLVVFRNAARWI